MSQRAAGLAGPAWAMFADDVASRSLGMELAVAGEGTAEGAVYERLLLPACFFQNLIAYLTEG